MTVSSLNEAQVLAYRVVVTYVGECIRRPPRSVNDRRTLTGASPKGYQFTSQGYNTLCDRISSSLSVASGRRVTLPLSWREKHFDDTISDFAAAVADRILASRQTPLAERAVAWTATL